MAAAATVPVTISSEARSHVESLGQTEEFAKMLDYLGQLPGLVGMNVILAHDPEGEDDPRVVFDAYIALPADAPRTLNPLWGQWVKWTFNRFSPDVIRHYVLMPLPGELYGRKSVS